MAEQWEHMTLLFRSESGNPTFTEVPAQGEPRELKASSVVDRVATLNRLGRDGWLLVSTNELSQVSFYACTYWLRRRIL